MKKNQLKGFFRIVSSTNFIGHSCRNSVWIWSLKLLRLEKDNNLSILRKFSNLKDPILDFFSPTFNNNNIRETKEMAKVRLVI